MILTLVRSHRMATIVHRARPVLFALALISVAGCSTASDPTMPIMPDGAGPTTVQVALGSITSVVVVDGTTVASPHFAIVAPSGGVVRFAAVVNAPEATTGAGSVIAEVSGQNAAMPAPGTLLKPLVADGAQVAAGLPLVTAEYAGFGVMTLVPVEDQYRIYDGPSSAKVNVTGGPGGVDCLIVDAEPQGGQPEGLGGGQAASPGTPVLCLLPLDAPVRAGLAVRAGFTTGARTDVLVIPVGAVSGRAGQGEVTKVDPSGGRARVTVGLGLTDGSNIEVTSGLNVGDTIVSVAPGLG